MRNHGLLNGLTRAFLMPFFLLFFSGLPAYAQVVDSAITEVPAGQRARRVAPFVALSLKDSMPVAVRNVNQNEVEKLKKDRDFWYAEIAPKRAKTAQKKATKGGGNAFTKDWLPLLLWIFLVAAFVLILRWFFIAGRNPFSKRQKRLQDPVRKELSVENIFDIEFEKEIQAAVAAENYGMAVRLHYLFLLKQLNQKGLINYRSELTNSDYLQQLISSEYYNDFFSLTRSFEYHWYGKFPVTKPAFESLESRFILFTKRVLK